ncbi:MAG: hypothetical protein DRI57_20270, partial [Deltaproteobacteria bacterium]
MKTNRTLEQNRQNMNQFFDKVTVQNILTCFLTVMILGFSLAGAHAETQADGLIHITTVDNENNDGTGEPDNDMGKELRPSIYNNNPAHPIEFNINVTGSLPVSSAYLSVFIEDIDWPKEQDEIFLNGRSLGIAVGENNLNNSTLFVIPDLSWVKLGNNLVQIFVDQNNTGWRAIVQSGQLIFDDNAGTDTTSIRKFKHDSDSSGYDYGETVTINLDADTKLATQNLRLELLLRDPAGEIIAFDKSLEARNWTISADSDELHKWQFRLPASGNDGLWGVSVTLYDIEEQLFLIRRTVTFSVPVGAALVPTPASITPDNCLAGEAKAVVITGSNFIPNETNCTVGNSAMDNLRVVDNTQITGNVPASLPPDTHDVICTTSNGEGTLSDAFTVTGPNISVSEIRDDTSYTFTVENTGNTELVMGNISIAGTGASKFTLQDDNCSGRTMMPSETCILKVVFSPPLTGSTIANVEIPSNDHDTPIIRINLGGEQGPAPTITRPATTDTAFADSEITVRGNADPGATVEIFVNGVSRGTALASSSGRFSLSGVQISQGENAVTAVATNAY